MLRAPGLAVAIAVVSVTTAAAQVCAGVQSFVGRPVELWGFASTATANNPSSQHIDSYGGGARLMGGRKAFGDVQLGAAHNDAYGGLSWLVGAGVAYQVSLNTKGTIQLCPEASVGFVLGPKNIDGSGEDYSETDAAVGAGIGVLASRSTQLDVVPTAALLFEHSNQKLKAAGTTTSASSSFEVIELGLGLVHRQRVSLKPSVSIPVGLSDAPTSFSLLLVYSVGGTR